MNNILKTNSNISNENISNNNNNNISNSYSNKTINIIDLPIWAKQPVKSNLCFIKNSK